MRRLFRPLGLALALLLAGIGRAPAQESVIRLVMNNELQSLDPVQTVSVVTRTFGFFVWDTLVGEDSKGVYRPQMLDKWEASTDRLTWTFTLRPGLEWHDGTPVTAEDCVASLRRWGAKDGLGRQMLAAARDLRVVDAKTFVLELSRPFGQVIEALGKSAPYAPFMMPARLAATSPNAQLPEIIGSGPFTFDRAEWRPGDRAVLRRNTRYRPRAEPADGLAGGKVVHVDRVDIVSLPDSSTRVAALQQGEIDWLERAPLDFVERMKRDRNVVVTPGLGRSSIFGVLTLNHAQPPFNNPAIRRAAQMAIDQSDVMAGVGLPRGMYLEQCLSVFMCDAPYSTDAGADAFRRPSTERARQMLRDAGYNNERVVILHSGDSALINPVSLVAIDQLKRAGFNVDVRSTDWSSVAQMRLNRNPVDQNGWSVVPLVWTGFDMENPLANPAVVYSCTNAYPGWWCDPARTALIERFAAEYDMAKRRELAAEIQRSVHDNVSIVILGQFAGPSAYRGNLRGVLDVGFPVLWNVQRAPR
jgi:peptide/nickel transport system substrate-binding protein